ncbi:DUF2845 domain-containing protein [Stenotrophomonas sp. ISL-67]|uniref:DUF2845 domain-containing protein n=1 Tax=Stenotrophomonas sp. ISL-67 TaxID=2819171 RepID=UPI001BE51CD4|nr:DUF2845 domain-containing protein [Stenotrophomonas sp. ISL-67]MBT2766926.1 DUF2845 domain-containing protein [Stenotrophomonas sp. ISL-67]
MMNSKGWVLALCLVAGSAMADSIRFERGLVNSGDTAGKVTQVAGKPDRVIQEESDQGGNVGERWEYYLQRKTVQVKFRDGRVVAIREIFN